MNSELPKNDRTATNQRNARLSTGPRTAEGKAASSQNRLAHGLCATSLLIRGESAEDFEALRQSMIEAYQPATLEERMMTDQLAEAQWRLNRARAAETKVFDLITGDALIRLSSDGGEVEDSPNHLLGCAMLNFDNHRVMANLNRYVTAAERTRQRALKELQAAQRNRPAVPAPAPHPEPEIAVAAGQPMPPIPNLPQTGFESQFSGTPAYTDRC